MNPIVLGVTGSGFLNQVPTVQGYVGLRVNDVPVATIATTLMNSTCPLFPLYLALG